MTLKARSVEAVSLWLADGIEAYFVQHGPDWNGLREYRCVAPGAFAGQKIITAADTGAEITHLFDKILGRVFESSIVMASPSLAAAILVIDKLDV